MVKSNEKQDRISVLPDSVIGHILSFLPSTKKAIQTGILSKGWKNQWTRVPVLIFNKYEEGMSNEKFLNFVNRTLLLHDCPKIKKFHLLYIPHDDPQLASKIRFATRRHVEDFNLIPSSQNYILPKFIFDNGNSLVKLKISRCTFLPNEKVNWGNLAALNLCNCNLTDQAMEHILSGSPFLESLELSNCFRGFDNKLVIVSNSLKRLVLLHLYIDNISVVKISCPKLEELSLKYMQADYPNLFARMIENVLSSSPLVKSLELCGHSSKFGKLVIVSKSMKRLLLQSLVISVVEISCPKLEELSLWEVYSNSNDPKLFTHTIENVLSSSPFLKSLKLCGHSSRFEKLLIASKSLKRLYLESLIISVNVEISCPKLEEFTLVNVSIYVPKLFGQVMDNVLSRCLLIESIKLINCRVPDDQLVIASKSLKRLVLDDLPSMLYVEISCPKLEKLKLSGGLNFETIKLLNLPSSLFVTINFYRQQKIHKSLVEDILHQLRNVKELKMGRYFVLTFSGLKVGDLFCPALNIKYMTLYYKTLPEFVRFLVKNARGLEKIVVISEDCETTLSYEDVLQNSLS